MDYIQLTHVRVKSWVVVGVILNIWVP